MCAREITVTASGSAMRLGDVNVGDGLHIVGGPVRGDVVCARGGIVGIRRSFELTGRRQSRGARVLYGLEHALMCALQLPEPGRRDLSDGKL